MHLRQRLIHHDIAVDVADAPITHRNQPASSCTNYTLIPIAVLSIVKSIFLGHTFATGKAGKANGDGCQVPFLAVVSYPLLSSR